MPLSVITTLFPDILVSPDIFDKSTPASEDALYKSAVTVVGVAEATNNGQ